MSIEIWTFGFIVTAFVVSLPIIDDKLAWPFLLVGYFIWPILLPLAIVRKFNN